MNGYTNCMKRTGQFFLVLLSLALMAGNASAIQIVNLVAMPFDKEVEAGPPVVTVPMWGFAQANNADCPATSVGLPSSPGPQIDLLPGETDLVINLCNQLPEPVSIIIPGMPGGVLTPVWNDGTGVAKPRPDLANPVLRVKSFAPETAPGTTGVYSWSIPTGLNAGSFIYQSGAHAAVQVPMGLYGAVVKDSAAGGVAYPGFPYDNQAIVFLSEIDPLLNQAVATGQYGPSSTTIKSTMDYNPKYFLINGQSYPNALPILNHSIIAGENILVRFFNAGIHTHVPSFTNLRINAIAGDGFPYPSPQELYSVRLTALGTVDALTSMDVSTCKAPIFDRLLYLTDNGTPGGGMVTYLENSAAACTGTVYYCDNDGDTFVSAAVSGTCQGAGCVPTTNSCGIIPGPDCNDDPLNNGASDFPGASDVCDGRDNDCDALTADGFGDGLQLNTNQQGVCAGSAQICTGIGGWVDDYTTVIGYEAVETTCDGVADNDCDGLADGVDPDCNVFTYYCDNDLDGFDSSAPSGTCTGPGCEVALGCVLTIGPDCNDDPLNNGASDFPGATEVCDGRDNDCNAGTADGSGEVAPLNTNQQGVCATSTQTCAGVGGWVDDYTTVTNYEAVEASCLDTFDNDCDTFTDAADSDCGAPSGPVIIDNGNPGTSSLGSWSNSSGTPYYGSVSQWSRTVNGTYTYEATLNGSFKISEWHTTWPSRCTAVPINVYDVGTSPTVPIATYTVNDQVAGGMWNLLGGGAAHTFTGTARVEIVSTGAGSCTTNADAIMFEVAGPPVITEDYYCDNDGDGAFSSALSGTCTGTGCAVELGCQLTAGTDCDDTNNAINPAATEICDGLDNDCNGATADGSGEVAGPNTLQQGVCAGSTQSCTGGAWIDDYSGIGTYEPVEASCSDILDNDCDGLVDNADDSCSAPPVSVIVDNGDPGTSSSGSWSTSGGTPPYGTNSLWSRTVNGSYTYETALTGVFTISEWHTTWPSRCTAVPINVYDVGTSTTAPIATYTVDHQANGGGWNLLGGGATHAFTGTARVVIVSTGAGSCTTNADAIMFESAGPPPVNYYCDMDGDTFISSTATGSCVGAGCEPAGCFLTAGPDCNDADFNIKPGATEVCDGVDNDCNAGTLDGSAEAAPPNSLQQGVCAGSSQTCSGGGWVDDYSGIGSYEAVETTCDGVADNDCDGLADGVDPDCAAPPVTVIIDNGDAGTSFSGTWSVSGGTPPYGTNSLWSRSVNMAYTYETALNGSFKISEWHTTWPSRCTAVPINVYDVGTSTTVPIATYTVNHQVAGGGWNLLGGGALHAFTGTARVEIVSTGAGSCTTNADAIMFETP